MENLKDKNILYITHAYKDWIKDPIEILSKEFNHVYVLVRHKPFADLLKFLNIPAIKILAFEYKFNLKDLPKNVTVLPVNMWYLPFKWSIDGIGDYHFKQALKVIKKNNIKFDIVHSHIVWSAGFVGMKLKEKFNVPFIVTGHGRDIYQRPYESKKRFDMTKKILGSADKVITVSHALEKEIKNISERKDITVIPNGFVGSRFSYIEKNKARDELKLDKDRKIAVFVGHIEPIKGLNYLVEAAVNVVKKFPDALFILIGNGPDKSKLENSIKEKGLEKNFMFTGLLPNEVVAKYNNAADIFILPSLGEGNPTVMFESIAVGLPFVGTKVGGIPEIINDDCGILVEPKDSSTLSEAIVKGFEKKWDREAIRKYASQFEWNIVTKEILKVYKSL